MKFEILNDVEYLKDIAENPEFFLDAIKDSDTYILRKMKELNVPIPLNTLRSFPNYLSYPEIVDAIKNDLTLDESIQLVVNGHWDAPFPKEVFSSPRLKDYIYDKSLKSGYYVFYALENLDYIPLDVLNNLDKLLVSTFNRVNDFKDKVKESLSRLSVDEIEQSLSVHYFLTPELNDVLLEKGANIANRENYWTEIPRAAFLVADTEVNAILDNYRKFKDTFCFMALDYKLLNADFFRQIIEIDPDVSTDTLLNGYLNNTGVWNTLLKEDQDTVIFPSVNGREEFTIKDFWKKTLNRKYYIRLSELNNVLSLDNQDNFDEFLRMVGDNSNSPVMKGALSYVKDSPCSGVSYEYKPYLNGSEMREFLNALYDVLPEGATSLDLDAREVGQREYFTGTALHKQTQMLEDAWARGDKELISAWADLIAKYDLTDNMNYIFSFSSIGVKVEEENSSSESFAGFFFTEILKQAPESLNKYLFARECLKKEKAGVPMFALGDQAISEIVQIFKGFPENLKETMNKLLFNQPLSVEEFNEIADFGKNTLNIFSDMRNKINSYSDEFSFNNDIFRSNFLNQSFLNVMQVAPLVLEKNKSALVEIIKDKIRLKESFSLSQEVSKHIKSSITKNNTYYETQSISVGRNYVFRNISVDEANYIRSQEIKFEPQLDNVVYKFGKCLSDLLQNAEKFIEDEKITYLRTEMDGYAKLSCYNFHYETDFHNSISLMNCLVDFIDNQSSKKRSEIISEISQNCTSEMKNFLLEVCTAYKKSENIEEIELRENVANEFISFFEKESFKNIQEIADKYDYKEYLLYNYSSLNDQNPDYLKKFFLRENPSFILNAEINSVILDENIENPIAPLKTWDELRSFIENDLLKEEKSFLLATVKDVDGDENLYPLFFDKIKNFSKDILSAGEDFSGFLQMLNDIRNPIAYIAIFSDDMFDFIKENSSHILSTSDFLREGFYKQGLKDLLSLNLEDPENLLIAHKVKKFLPLIPNKDEILKELLNEKLFSENSIVLRNLLLVHAEGEITTDGSKLISLCKGNPDSALTKILDFPHQSEEMFNFFDFVAEQSKKVIDFNKDTTATLFQTNQTFHWFYNASKKNPDFLSVLEAKRNDVMLNIRIKGVIDNASHDVDNSSQPDSFKL